MREYHFIHLKIDVAPKAINKNFIIKTEIPINPAKAALTGKIPNKLKDNPHNINDIHFKNFP